MSSKEIDDVIFQLISENGPLTSKELQEILERNNFKVTKENINSVLYGALRNSVIRDVNQNGVPTWRIKTAQFSAAGGLEAKFYNELLKRKIITKENSQLGFGVKNTKNNKRYHLDILIRKENTRYNIEIDGFDHIRADALESIDRQIEKKGKNAEIEIDWMDHVKSYTDFSKIDTKKVYKWCGENINWCVRYHEELLWPKDITRNIFLIDKGFRVIRFWNDEIRNNINRCIQDVEEFMS